jgi:hypothetical protein
VEPAWAWGVLGLTPGATPDDVRRAFRVASQLLHPDRVADLSPEVQREAHRRMVELGEAYRVATALAKGAPPPPPRAHRSGGSSGPLAPAGEIAAELLRTAMSVLPRLAPAEDYRLNRPTRLGRDENATVSRQVVATLLKVADAFPGTAEGDRARALLVSSVAARNALSARERAGHLVLVVDEAARDAAWDALTGRDELAVAQVVYAHPTATGELRRRARTRLAELGDWASLVADDDPDIRQAAAVQLLLQEARALAERAAWLTRRERAGFDAEVSSWCDRAAAARAGLDVADLRADLDDAERLVRDALAPARR